MTNNKENEPIFDMSNADWEYLAIVSFLQKCPHGFQDTMALFYRDGDVKFIGRIIFPSGSKLKFTRNGFKDLDVAIDSLKVTLNNINKELEATIVSEVKIFNTSKKAKDLFDLMCQSQNLEITSTEYKVEK